jgi:hypothetical protein
MLKLVIVYVVFLHDLPLDPQSQIHMHRYVCGMHGYVHVENLRDVHEYVCDFYVFFDTTRSTIYGKT